MNISDDGSHHQVVDLIVEAVACCLPLWWPMGHGKQVTLHTSQSLLQGCWWGIGCLPKSASVWVLFQLDVHSPTITGPHRTVHPEGLSFCGTISRLTAGAWSCKGSKSNFESSLLFLGIALSVLGIVDCGSMGRWRLSSKLSLGYLSQPAKENFSFPSPKFSSMICDALGEKKGIYICDWRKPRGFLQNKSTENQ